MKTRLSIALLLVLLLSLSCACLLAAPAQAAQIVASGTCGQNTAWTLDAAGTLTISGTGEIADVWDAAVDRHGWLDYNNEDNDFFQNTFIQKVIIEEGITHVGVCAFAGCRSLRSVTLPNSVISVGYNAFLFCDQLQYTEYYGNQYLGNATNPYVALIYGKGSNAIHENTQAIAGESFAGSNIGQIKIPKNVVTIGEFAFDQCKGLLSIRVDAENPNYSSDSSGVLFNKEKTVLIKAPAGLSGAYTVANTVVEIHERAFAYCEYLRKLTLPDSVEAIGNSAFLFCTRLADLSVGNGLQQLGKHVFIECNSLKFRMEDNVHYLGNAENPYLILVRAARTDILSCQIADGTKFICEDAFLGCDRLRVVVIPSSIQQIGCCAFPCSALWHVLYQGTQTQAQEIRFCEDYHGGGPDCADIHFPELFTLGYSPSCAVDYAWCCYGNTLLHFDCTGDEVTDPMTQRCTLCCTHSYEPSESTPPTCSQPGANVFLCPLCGDTQTETIEPTGQHSFDNDQDATCNFCDYTRTVETTPEPTSGAPTAPTQPSTGNTAPSDHTQAENPGNPLPWILVIILVVAIGGVLALFLLKAKKK